MSASSNQSAYSSSSAMPGSSTPHRGQVDESYYNYPVADYSLLSPSSALGRGQLSSDNIPIVKTELTSSPDFRTIRLPTVPSTPDSTHSYPPNSAIHSQSNTYTYNSSQDVRSSVNISASNPLSTVPRNGYPSSSFETNRVSNSNTHFSQHGLTNPSNRPRTSNHVFVNSNELAQHYGIPQQLPPPPRTTPFSYKNNQNRSAVSNPAPQPRSPPTDFSSLAANYLTMLSSKPTDNNNPSIAPSGDSTVLPTVSGFGHDELHSIAEILASSPQFQDSPSFDFDQYLASPMVPSNNDDFDSDFLTSPMAAPPLVDFDGSPLDDTPYADFLSTPVISDANDALFDNMTSPIISGDMNAPVTGGDFDMMMTGPVVDYSDMGLYGDMTMFAETMAGKTVESVAKRAPAAQTTAVGGAGGPQLDGLYTMSPSTPAMDTFDAGSLYPQKRAPTKFPTSLSYASQPPAASPAPTQQQEERATSNAGRRKSSATGTRKGVTPETLVPLDAPTQPRRYVMPSATSRKEVPAVFARKRGRSEAFGEEDDELEEEPLAPNATEKEQIEWKRRQNTLAARKSRKRKLEHQQELEGRVEQLERDVQVWKTRAETLQGMLTSYGAPVIDWEAGME